MLDLNYFDEEFTREAPQLSYTGTPGFKFDQDIFSGFSYNGESEMRNFGDHPMPPSSLSRNGKWISAVRVMWLTRVTRCPWTTS